MSFQLFKPRSSLDPNKAWACFVANQLVTPGLGSLMAGRWIAGVVELALAVPGFVLIMLWFFQLFRVLLRDGTLFPEMDKHVWMLKLGAALFAGSWCLALVSSILILRRAARETPPKLG